MSENSSFGDYLKVLVKDTGITQHEFCTALGIKKPYFYDILSRRTNQPPPELQFRAMEILNADEFTQKHMLNLTTSGWIGSDSDEKILKIKTCCLIQRYMA